MRRVCIFVPATPGPHALPIDIALAASQAPARAQPQAPIDGERRPIARSAGGFTGDWRVSS